MNPIDEAGRRVGVFGGTFNPIHYGHLRAALEVREKLGFEKIFFVPSGNPPLKSSDLAPAADRHEMTRLATVSHPFFEVSDIECKQQGKSYTVNTLRVLRSMHPGIRICLVLGIDSFLEIPAWYQHMKLLEEADFVVISRPGCTFSSLSPMLPTDPGMLATLDATSTEVLPTHIESGRDAILLNVTPFHISATMIRDLLRGGKSIKYLLPEAVESYIISHNLFLEGSGSLRK
jgi:nicotinate-nucleotide adenylyltransferase